MIKYLFILSLVIYLGFSKSNKNDYIEFRHVGVSNKYIQTLLIVKQVVKQDWESKLKTEVVVVNGKTFDCIYDYLYAERKLGLGCTDSLYAYGSFKINVVNSKSENFCFIVKGRKQSLAHFQGVTEYLRRHCADKNLIETIKGFIIENINKTPPVGSGFE